MKIKFVCFINITFIGDDKLEQRQSRSICEYVNAS